MANERVVTELVIDASGAEAGSARYSAAMQRAERAGDSAVLKQDAIDKAVGKVVVSLDRKAERLSAVDRQYQRLAAAIDPVVAAQQRYERAVSVTERAVRLGRITQEEATRTLAQYQARLTSVSTTADQTAAAVGRAGYAFRGVGGAFQQAGYQLGDFAVQVASGQGVIRPLIQQGTQIVQAFGPWGAVLGAAGAVAGSLAVAFLDLGDSTEETKKAQEDYNRSIEDYIDLTANDNERAAARNAARIRETQGILAQSHAQRELNIQELEARRLRLQRRQEATGEALADPGLVGDIAEIDRRIASQRDLQQGDQQRIDMLQFKLETDEYFKSVEDGLKRQGELAGALSDFQRDAAEAASKAAKEYEDQRKKAAKETADELNRWLDLQQEALKADGERVKAQTDLERAQMAANDNLETYIRKLEDAATVDGRTTTEKKIQEAVIEAQNKLYDKQGDKIRDLEQAEKDRIATAVRQTEELDKQRKAAEQAARDLEKATDRAVENTADLFYDAFEGKIGSIGDLLQRTLKRSVAEGLAELLRPAISLGVGTVRNLFGFGAPASLAGSGQIAGTANGGGFGLSNLSSLTNLVPSSWTSGITSGINAFGASYLGLNSAAATQAAASTYGISAGQAAALSNAGALGSTASLSTLLGAGGIGITAGMLLRSLTDNKLISGGGGALAGAGIGFLMGGPLGAAVGGITGLLSGVLGPGKSVGPVGHTNINAVNGRLVVGSTGTDNGANAQVTIQQAQQLAEAVNRLADSYNLSITAGTTISQGAASGPQSVGAALQALLSKGGLSSSDAVMQSILGRTGSAADLEANLQFGALYNSMVKLKQPANDLRDAFKTLSEQFDTATRKAVEFGFGSEDLRRGTAANFNQEIERAIRGITDPLGLALDDYAEVADARLEYARKIGADIVEVERLNMLERQKIIEQGGADLKAWLNAQLLGTTSTLSGGLKLDEAQSQFAAAVSAARDGSGGINAVTQLGDIILGLGQQLFGGTAQAAALQQMVRSTVSSLGRDLGYPGFDTGGSFTVGAPNMGWGGVDATLVRFRANQGETVTVTPAGSQTPGASSRDIGELALILTRMQGDTSGLRQAVEGQSAELRKLGQLVDLLMNRAMANKAA